jgi:rfaE bifunctional protein kinase chain/domain
VAPGSAPDPRLGETGGVSALAEALERLTGVRVLTVGDLMLDEYVWGRVSRISPEAPVPVVEVDGHSHVPGGAANVASGVVALGGSAVLGGVVGADEPGRRLREALAERSVDCGGVLDSPGRRTTVKTRVIAHSQQVVRTDFEGREPLEDDLAERLIGWAAGELDGIDVLVLSDYAKGLLTPYVLQSLIEQATNAGKPIVVDPKGVRYERYRGATVLTPNVHDAERAAQLPVQDHDDLLEVSRRLESVLPGTHLLITRGAEGMSLMRGGESVDIAADARDVYDVTGAGDTVVATLAAALGRGVAVEDAVRLANAAAGIAVGKVGTASVTLDELRERVS